MEILINRESITSCMYVYTVGILIAAHTRFTQIQSPHLIYTDTGSILDSYRHRVHTSTGSTLTS